MAVDQWQLIEMLFDVLNALIDCSHFQNKMTYLFIQVNYR